MTDTFLYTIKILNEMEINGTNVCGHTNVTWKPKRKTCQNELIVIFDIIIFNDRTHTLYFIRFVCFSLFTICFLPRVSEVDIAISLHQFGLILKVRKNVNVKVYACLLFCYHDL
jgi:hypothetical protein